MPAPRSPRRARLAVLVSAALALTGLQMLAAAAAQADVTSKISTFPYAQNWSDTGLITANDNWSGVTGVQGYLGQDLTTATGTDPQTLTAESAVANDTDVIANQTSPTITSGGVAEFDGIADPTIALQGSGTADAPYVAFHLDLTALTGVQFSFDARDIDPTSDDAAQPIAVQYRVGTSGAFTNLPAGFIADATTAGTATQVTHKDVPLPASTDNQGDVFVRVITANAVGSDEWVGIDNIAIATGGTSAPLAATAPGTKTGVVGQPITPFQLQATGGTPDYHWTATGLPAWVTVADDGTVSGTPTDTGTFTGTVTVTDSAGTPDSDSQPITFTISPAPTPIPIADIQGTTDTSPYNNQTVTTQGVVTAAYKTGGFNGFYIQTPGTPNTPGASDAVFVFSSAATALVHLNDSVQVTGKVSEFNHTTEIAPASVSDVTVLDSSLGTVTPLSAQWSDLDTDAKKEAHEGELVAPQGDFTVTDNYNTNFYGEIELAAGDQMLKQPTDVGTPGSQAAQDAAAYNTVHQVFLDDGASWSYTATSHSSDPMPWLTPATPVSDGAKVTFHQPVVLEFRNSQWDFQPQQQVTGDGSTVATFSDMRTANAAPANVGGDVRLATFNMENFFTTTGDEFVSSGQGTCTFYKDRQGNEITDNNCTTTGGGPGPRGAATDAAYQKQLNKELVGIDGLGASVVSLEEVENAVKFGESRDATVSALVDALNAKDGAGTWAYVPSPAAGDLPPVGEQDVIRTAFIYKPAAITPVGVSHVLTGDSDDGQPFSIAREPMAQGFKATGARDSDAFMVVANHLKSKGADADSLFSDCGPGGTIGVSPGTGDDENTDPVYDQGAFNCSRVHQVHDMWTWAQQQAQNLGTDRVFLVGDFNAYDHEDPIEYLYGQGFTDLASTYDASHSSYSYGGLEGSLDHVLASPAALAMVTGATIWQIDAQESVAFAYSRDNYNITQLYDGTAPWATSDHDPEIVGLDFPEESPTTTTAGDVSVSYGQAASVPVTVTSPGGTPSGTVQLMDGTTVVATGSLDAAGKVTLTVPARAYPPGTRTLTVKYAGDATHVASEKTLTLSVTKASSTTTAKVKPKHPKKNHKVKLKVTVDGANGVQATGKVEVKLDGEKYTGTLVNGRVMLKTGRLGKGSYQARVVYLGDADVAGSRTKVKFTVS